MSAGDTPLITFRLAAGLVLVSVLSLIAFAALSAYAPELRADNSGGGNALSKSATGFAGLRFLAEQAGISTTLGREPPPADRYSLIVLTPEPATAPSELAKIAYPGPRLIVLPKWITASLPGHSGWVMKVDIADTKSVASSLASIATRVTVAQGKGISRTHLLSRDWRFGSLVPENPVSLDSIQTISGPSLEPDIVDDQGNAVLVQIHGTQIYILAEPDLLNNRGIHDLPTAQMAFGLIPLLRVGQHPISFDITLNGFHQSPSLLRAMFSPPFLGATLCAILAAAFIAFHAFSRFGAAERPDCVFAFGKRALADNTAAVIRLIAEKRLGGLALLRNLRLMQKAQVPRKTIADAIEAMRTDRVLPYRFITAARYAPDFEPELESAMLKSIKGYARLSGRTRLLIDVSGSMFAPLSAQSEMMRAEAACGLAILAREVYDEVEIFTFSSKTVKVPLRRGFALRDAIVNSQPHGNTMLGAAVSEIDRKGDRLIVFTDEQSHDRVPEPKGSGYMVNVASFRHGVGNGPWKRVDGFSEAVIAWIAASEGTMH